jgi:hypothetical protein
MDQNIKIRAFQQKKELLELLNGELEKLGYTRKVTDIRF